MGSGSKQRERVQANNMSELGPEGLLYASGLVLEVHGVGPRGLKALVSASVVVHRIRDTSFPSKR